MSSGSGGYGGRSHCQGLVWSLQCGAWVLFETACVANKRPKRKRETLYVANGKCALCVVFDSQERGPILHACLDATEADQMPSFRFALRLLFQIFALKGILPLLLSVNEKDNLELSSRQFRKPNNIKQHQRFRDR